MEKLRSNSEIIFPIFHSFVENYRLSAIKTKNTKEDIEKMINSIQITEATVKDVKRTNQVLTLSLLSTNGSQNNSYFQAKLYAESSQLKINVGTKLALDGKIAFDANRKAYVAINFPNQVELVATQRQTALNTVQVKGEVVKSNSVQQFNSQRTKSTVVQKGEVILLETKKEDKEREIISSLITSLQDKKIQRQQEQEERYGESYENWNNSQYDEEYCEKLDHSQYDNDTVPSDWDEIAF